jgi:1-acyl-sn-glycerol-3-phosphate acyltransferase
VALSPDDGAGASGIDEAGSSVTGDAASAKDGDAPLVLDVVVDTRFTPLYRILRFLVRLVNAVYFRTSVANKGAVPAEGPVIIAPVHRSFIDFFVASEVTDRKLHYMAKDSLWKNGTLAKILPSVGAFPVHRESADREATRRAQQVLDAGEVLILFPEGERRTGPVVEDLHEGVAFLAARTGATVIPVGIGGSASVMPKGTKIPRPRHIHLEVGEPLAPPERGESGRVPRSRVHRLTEQLTVSLQELYDRAVEVAGRY